MKKFLLVVTLLSVCLSSFAKEDVIGKPMACDTVLKAEGISASQIYSGAKAWFAKNMRSAQDVIQLDDAANAHIIGKANIDFPVKSMTWHMLSGVIDFTIEIQAKDGRFKLKLYNFIHKNNDKRYGDAWSEGLVYYGGKPENLRKGHGKQYEEMQKRALPLIIDNMARIISSLQEEIKNSADANNDDW